MVSTPVIVDSECANLNSIYKAAQVVGLNPTVTDDPKVISSARAVIFPGVGSFAHAVSMLRRKKIIYALLEVLAAGRPFLGICLGMQLLFTGSEESGPDNPEAEGLRIIQGTVKRFPRGLPVPHVGWNRVKPVCEHPLFAGFRDNAYFYFTHSYYVEPELDSYTLAVTDYGFDFTSAVLKGSLLGVQFHPEKSGPAGLRLLANFGKIIAENS